MQFFFRDFFLDMVQSNKNNFLDGTLTGTTTPGKIGLGSNRIEELLHAS